MCRLGMIKVGKKTLRLAALAGAGLIGFAAPAFSGGQSLAMLDQLDSGRWELRLREPGTPVQRLCIDSGRRLIQLRHQAEVCDRFIVQDVPNEVTVQYTCKGRGYGRTHIRRESDRLVQIDSQGIAGGLPFEFSAEARRIGECRS